ncbi:peroxiredoxin [Algoriphagus sp. 4150]|uniref:peroxiredoxin family protein n=1 Tax=Algoriphagus sp. 4150 TaxID=2817756 RepID=UPI002854891C|nr:redoxin domain-containing protein [Algoriphagus sp. 4150]MDR7131683.1 peroxiredoxin [Algoriphagus sp. 4150]
MRIKSVFILSFTSFFTASCYNPQTPEELFDLAKTKLLGADEVRFNMTTYWEDPNLKEIEITESLVRLQKKENKFFDYNYIGEKESSVLAYLDDVLLLVNHTDSTVKVYEENPIDRYEHMASDNIYLNYSPIGLMRKKSWTYSTDTVIDNKTYHDFVNVEMDTLIDDKHVYLENHLMINPANALVDYYSRRLFHNGMRSQLIEVEFSAYEFPINEPGLSYLPPPGYTSQTSGDNERKVLLSKGEQAPDFELTDLEGNKVKLSDYRGKKVFLDFSMIRCGWCKIALEEFNKDDFNFKENIVPLYINPVDEISLIKKYAANVRVSFPILPNAKQVGEEYGVSGYPSFYLIDEAGKIELSFSGFDEKQINKVRL